MPVSKAVATLNNDLNHLVQLTKAQHTSERGYNVDVQQKKAALAAIEAAKKRITDQFAGPVNPTGTREKALLNQLFALGTKAEVTKDAFDARLAKDKGVIASYAKQAAAWKKRGLHDLLPAEYVMGLAETNRDRKLLGLAPLKAVLRPPAPKPQTYTVKAGDTMGGIARAHGMTLQALAALNPQVRNLNQISVGQKLTIKAGSVKPTPPATGADAIRAKAVAYAIRQANDPNVGYSQDMNKRMGQGAAGSRRYYDCSGLVYMAYKSAGVTLGGDDTREMWNTWRNWATQVPKNVSAMKPGDLIVTNSDSPVSHHVLMYVGPNGKCVAASTDGIALDRQVRVGDNVADYFKYGSRCMVLRPNV